LACWHMPVLQEAYKKENWGPGWPRQKHKPLRLWWFTPVMLATCKVVIRRIMVPGQPKPKSLQDPISTNKKARQPIYVGRLNRRITVHASLGINVKP
jgi:hypothetical protein